MGLPDGWNEYDRVGKQVHGTRFIAFKVPLKEGINKGRQVPEDKQLYPKLLVSLEPKLGLVIDLTNTYKYYNPDEFLQLGVQYQKIQVQGQKVPSYECSQKFRQTVNAFLEENKDNDKLIGVHCTHGLNRSGFLVCRYMIEEMKVPPLDAIAAFETARGHKMERANYLDKLKQLRGKGEGQNKPPFGSLLEPSLAIDTDTDKGTQTNRGFWIDERSIPAYHRSAATSTDSHISEQKQVVNLIGCVNARRKDLIPDGRGGFFVHVTRKDIQRNEPTPPPNWGPNGLVDVRRPPPPIHLNDPFVQRSLFTSGPFVNPPRERHIDRHYDRPNDNMVLGNMGDTLPLGSNNIAADLLRMPYKGPNMNKRRNRQNRNF